MLAAVLARFRKAFTGFYHLWQVQSVVSGCIGTLSEWRFLRVYIARESIFSPSPSPTFPVGGQTQCRAPPLCPGTPPASHFRPPSHASCLAIRPPAPRVDSPRRGYAQ